MILSVIRLASFLSAFPHHSLVLFYATQADNITFLSVFWRPVILFSHERPALTADMPLHPGNPVPVFHKAWPLKGHHCPPCGRLSQFHSNSTDLTAFCLEAAAGTFLPASAYQSLSYRKKFPDSPPPFSEKNNQTGSDVPQVHRPSKNPLALEAPLLSQVRS